MGIEPKFFESTMKHDKLFSVCTLVRNESSYRDMISSFESKGFNKDNSEFLAADNRQQNNFDGYNWTTRAILEASGKYVIICHDDVRLVHDDIDVLLKRLEEVQVKYPSWSIVGTVGCEVEVKNRDRGRITGCWINGRNGFRQSNRKNLPALAQSLDEFFLVIRREHPVMASLDLSGFHFYGADLCTQANLRGGEAIIINFIAQHLSFGKPDQDFRDAVNRFADKYRSIFPGRIVDTTVGTFDIDRVF